MSNREPNENQYYWEENSTYNIQQPVTGIQIKFHNTTLLLFIQQHFMDECEELDVTSFPIE